MVPICKGGTVPIPGYKHKSKLLGTFHSQGGWDGFRFFLQIYSVFHDSCSYRQISRGLISSAECGNKPAAHGTKVQPLLVWSSWMELKKDHTIGTSSDVLHFNKTYRSILLRKILKAVKIAMLESD